VIRRAIRIAFRIGLLAAVAFVLLKLLQSRRATPALTGRSQWTPPSHDGGRRTTREPLARPRMRQGVGLEGDGRDGEASPAAPAPPPPSEATVAVEAEPTGLAPADSPNGDSGQGSAGPRSQAAAAAAPARGPARKAAKKAGARAAKSAGGRVWVEPRGSVCPPTHPIKAKLKSGIFHLPGMVAYERTNPDRCYKDPKAAESDGLRQAKR
jgi:hypothetical protein